MTANIKIIVFGILAEKMQTKELMVENISDTDALMHYIKQTYPVLNDIKMSIAVNKNIITQNLSIKSGDEIALLPPFSGG